jgi:hypothetical protein
MATSQQQWRHGSQLVLLAAALALVLLIAAGSVDAGCSSGYSVCDGHCVNLKTDPYNCKSCNYVCKKYPHTVTKCKYGVCSWECEYLYGNCDHNNKNGCETHLGSDKYNCGKCGHKCKLSPYYKNGEVYCRKGNCKSECKPGWKYNSSGKYCYKSS